MYVPDFPQLFCDHTRPQNSKMCDRSHQIQVTKVCENPTGHRLAVQEHQSSQRPYSASSRWAHTQNPLSPSPTPENTDNTKNPGLSSRPLDTLPLHSGSPTPKCVPGLLGPSHRTLLRAHPARVADHLRPGTCISGALVWLVPCDSSTGGPEGAKPPSVCSLTHEALGT